MRYEKASRWYSLDPGTFSPKDRALGDASRLLGLQPEARNRILRTLILNAVPRQRFQAWSGGTLGCPDYRQRLSHCDGIRIVKIIQQSALSRLQKSATSRRANLQAHQLPRLLRLAARGP